MTQPCLRCTRTWLLVAFLLVDWAPVRVAEGLEEESNSPEPFNDQALVAVSPPLGGAPGDGKAVAAAVHIVSPVRSTTPEALKAEIIAAEAALTLRAEVDGAPAVYDSPSVSVSLRKVSPGALVQSGANLETVDGAGITIPADPRVRGKHGGPVTITVTSFHAGDGVKELPTVKYGANRELRRVGGPDAISGTKQKEDRVDFFMAKTSVSWRGTVDVKVPGLAAQVPAHDRPWTPYGTDGRFVEEKAEVRREVEALAILPETSSNQKQRGLRQLARRWHPDKNPEDVERATEVFTYLQELKAALFPASATS
mmetsp:Transcript_147935/g.368640  ORF Transcript_147935/g.368640 Transcript_147935/m.368640 type:complete len:311 (+) Transcript_147935:174-1106(+)